VFAAGVGEQREFGFGHAFPEAGEAAIVAIDVLAVREAFHHDRAACQAATEFFESVGTPGMDGDGGEEFGMLAGELEDVIVGDVKGAGVFEGATVIVVDEFLGEDDGVAEGGGADVGEEALDVEAVEVTSETTLGQADAANHEGGERAMPAGDAEPAAGAAGAVADDVDVRVDG